VLGTVPKSDRSLSAERASAGCGISGQRTKKLGRPRRILNEQRISALRAQGLGLKAIAADMGQSQTAAVGLTTFAVVTFSGSVINNTDAPIAFQLAGGPVPFEPFVASF
jgi:hypothetical protein